MDVGVTGKLKVGDIIYVDNPMRKEEYSYYRVNSVEGNKAHTDFRTFNVKIYYEKSVYEYGKRLNSIYNNGYTLCKEIPESIKSIMQGIGK